MAHNKYSAQSKFNGNGWSAIANVEAEVTRRLKEIEGEEVVILTSENNEVTRGTLTPNAGSYTVGPANHTFLGTHIQCVQTHSVGTHSLYKWCAGDGPENY